MLCLYRVNGCIFVIAIVSCLWYNT